MKFGRNYVLTIQETDEKTRLPKGPPIVIRYPLTMQAHIERHNYSGANSANITLYGLGPSTRNKIFYDWYFKPVLVYCTLNAGYDSDGPIPPQIFAGNINLAYSDRQGVEVVTHIQALDGGFAMATNNFLTPTVIPAKTAFAAAIKKIMNALGPTIKTGQVLVATSKFAPLDFALDVPLNGKVWQVLQANTPSDCRLFIDNGIVHMLGPQDVLPLAVPGKVIEISPSNGLLNIPKKTGSFVDVLVLFEPKFVIGQKVNLFSSLNSQVNGLYAISGISHDITIGGTDSQEATTALTMVKTT